MSRLNRQMILNISVAGLAAQGFARSMASLPHSRPDYGNSLQCAYRSPPNDEGTCLKCAIGHLIPDGSYTPDLEGTTASAPKVRQLLTEEYGGKDGIVGEDMIFLDDLQYCHDHADKDVYGGRDIDMRRRLITFASKHKLVVPTELST